MKHDPKPHLSRAALEACKTYWKEQWLVADINRIYADDKYGEVNIKLYHLKHENQTPIRSTP